MHDRVQEQWVVVRRSLDGVHWEPQRVLASKTDWVCHLQNITYDAEIDRLIVIYDEHIYLHDGTVKPGSVTHCAMISDDAGASWTRQTVQFLPNSRGLVASAHGSGAGIQLVNDAHRGRLITCARVSTVHDAMSEQWENLRTKHWNCSLYSDDHGMTWQTGGEAQPGTGEGVLCELSDGSIYLNSRAYFNDGMRRTAISHDGGETFGEFRTEPQLPEIDFGVNAALVCLPGCGTDRGDLCVYTSLDDLKVRRNLTAWISYDATKTWTTKKMIDSRFSAYSSLAYDARKKLFYLLYEYGQKDPYDMGLCVAAFNLEWLLE
ncbi:MAG: exo-alpha-sialidase [Clostridia bacterium]|nr:exo-alpha-sialidase [Clostridia bacterium]